jgi:hypothetical protein
MNKFKRESSFLRIICIISVSLGLFGCATSPAKSPTGEPITNVIESLKKGDLRLDCLLCGGTAGFYNKKIIGFFNNQLWNDLAIEIARIGYNEDLAYYYLGRARIP